MGPVAIVLLPQGLSVEEVITLARWVRALGPVGRDEGWREWMLSVRHYEALGITDHPETQSCAFWLTREDQSGIEFFRGSPDYDDMALRQTIAEDEAAQRALLGFDTQEQITVSVGCKKPIDHRILAELSIRLAERFNGMIDLCGDIYFSWPKSPRFGPSGIIHDEEVERLRAQTRAVLKQLPGRLYETQVTLVGGRRSAHHIVDVEFLRAWMAHPDFHMIK